MHDKINRLAIVDLAKELNRPIKTLFVLDNDSFYITDAKRREAEWFATLYAQYGFGRGSYLRRIHYQWASLATIVDANGLVYENTDSCRGDLQRASLFARYLALIPAGDLEDHRSPDVTFHLEATPEKPRVATSGPCRSGPGWLSLSDMSPIGLGLPELRLTDLGDLPDLRVAFSPPGRLSLPRLGEVEDDAPVPPYHLEILCEKTACADVLRPHRAAPSAESDLWCRRHVGNAMPGTHAPDRGQWRSQGAPSLYFGSRPGADRHPHLFLRAHHRRPENGALYSGL